ncbi:hypothetical protein D3C83_125070 [compost metagenome]
MDRHRVEPQQAFPPVLFREHEIGALEHVDVLQHRDTAHVVEEFAHAVHVAARLLLEHVEDAAARLAGERGEHGVHLVGVHMSP